MDCSALYFMIISYYMYNKLNLGEADEILLIMTGT